MGVEGWGAGSGSERMEEIEESKVKKSMGGQK